MDISLAGLINFLLGIFSGFLLFTIVYIYFFVRGKNIDVSLFRKPDTEVDEEELKQIVTDKQETFKKMKRKGESIGKLTFSLSYELIEEIAKYYFPKSKYPMLELSVDEMLALNHYITERIDGILNQPILKNTRNIRVTKLVRMYEAKRSFDQNKIVKAAKNKVVKKSVKYTLGAVNLMNPAYWFRKLVVNKSVGYIENKIALLIIGVVGEETIKVYSKKLFDKEVELDFVDQALKSLETGDDSEDN
ncbi:MAG: hypothetical protein ACOC1L_01000 [Bacillota bacterium]